ncbi:MAG: dihydroneopterin aldolase [Bacteroidetes bacterium]|nr:MAG: dihydroneopterin aldolase [Bacteroidota bacterium]
MDFIYIEEITSEGRHGVYPREKTQGNRFEVTLRIQTSLREAAQSDRLAHTLDYQRAYDAVLEVMKGPSVNLLERLAALIAEKIMDRFPEVAAVRVRVSKLQPRNMPQCQRTSVEMDFERESLIKNEV